MATRRQRRQQRQQGKQLAETTEALDEPSSGSEPSRHLDNEETRALHTPWDRLGGVTGRSPLAVLLVVAYVVVPAALGQLVLPLFGPTRLVLEPFDQQLRASVPSLLGFGGVAAFGTYRLVRWLDVPDHLASLFYLGAALTTLAWGFQVPSLINAKLDVDKGYIQSLNGAKVAGSSVFVMTDLKPGVALLRSTFSKGCRNAPLGARCRFTVRSGKLGLQWAEPNPDEGQ